MGKSNFRLVVLEALSNVNIDLDTGCHIYLGNIDPGTGYGRIMINGIRYGMHRLSCYVHHSLDLTDGEAFACHKCNNRACINPQHLYVGTNKQNQLDYIQDKCKYGHSLVGGNIMWRYRPNGIRYRNCKACHKRRSRQNRNNKSK